MKTGVYMITIGARSGRGSFELDDGLPHDECDYFAVYGVGEPFSEEALALHDVV